MNEELPPIGENVKPIIEVGVLFGRDHQFKTFFAHVRAEMSFY